MDKKELEEAFLAGWEARHNLYSSEACHVARDRQLKEWLATLEPLTGTHG